MDWALIILRIIHIFSGVFWVGAAWMAAFFLLPTAIALGPDAGKFMSYLTNVRRYPVVATIAAVLTVLAGITLYWKDYGGITISTAASLTFTIGGLAGITALIIGGAVVGPTAARIGKLGAEIQTAGKPPSPDQVAEMQKLQKRMQQSSLLVAVILAVALLCMASARYL